MALIEINRNPSRRELAWFGLLLALFGLVVAALLHWQFAASGAARIVAIAGGVVAVVYYAVPAWRRPIYLGWLYASYPIGWLVSHLLLGIIYFLILTPIGMIRRLVGRDRMGRRFDPVATTYWIRRAPASDRARYFKQH